MKQAFEAVKQLVEDFKNNEKFYLSDKYQESQARQDFIDKFFAALGWDVTHARQKNPYEQEVKIENKVSTQGSQRRADYAFFIAPNFRDVKFYAEAKKPAKNLKDAAFYHQTIRYGWNSGTPIAILTDFEEFHVLDCRYKPDLQDALNRQLAYFHYSEYSDEEKFKKIFYLFQNRGLKQFSEACSRVAINKLTKHSLKN
jgi:adenine-specific DNA-methyltransferase